MKRPLTVSVPESAAQPTEISELKFTRGIRRALALLAAGTFRVGTEFTEGGGLQLAAVRTQTFI